MKHWIALSFALFTLSANAQDAALILSSVRSKFDRIQDLRCNVQMEFNIPGVRMDQLAGKLLYKKPDKFKVSTKGLVFVPKQNPFSTLDLLAKPESYMAMTVGTEVVNSIACHIINLIPANQDEMVMMRLFIGKADGRIHRSDITLRREGTVVYRNTYANITDVLPTMIEFEADFKKFRLPKAITGDMNAKTVTKEDGQKYETGRIRMSLSQVELNKKLDDGLFKDEVQ